MSKVVIYGKARLDGTVKVVGLVPMEEVPLVGLVVGVTSVGKGVPERGAY